MRRRESIKYDFSAERFDIADSAAWPSRCPAIDGQATPRRAGPSWKIVELRGDAAWAPVQADYGDA